MILYYTLGGGLGHITRTNEICKYFHIPFDSIIFLSSSDIIKEIIPGAKYIVPPLHLRKDKPKLCLFIESILVKYDIQTIFLDAFPFGILGELEHFSLPGITFFYVARILQWQKYLFMFEEIPYRFRHSFICEHLPDEQFKFIQQYSNQYSNFIISYSTTHDVHYQIIRAQISNCFIVLVHSGPLAEVRILLNKAIDHTKKISPNCQIIAFTRNTPVDEEKQVKWFNYTKAYLFFSEAKSIISGCGFNTMQQCRQLQFKHICIPFQRRFDDQSLRKNFFHNAQ